MKYTDLTLNQRIGLKGEIMKNPDLKPYRMCWIFFGFVKAVEFFFNNDINALGDGKWR